jgi:DGQHR domain-containing protein
MYTTSISVKAIKIKHKDLPLYLFGMPASQILDISYILPRSRDDPDEIERVLDRTRVQEISDYIGNANSYLPSAILLNFDPGDNEQVKFADKEGESIIQISLPDQSKAEVREQIEHEIADGKLEIEGDEAISLEVERRLTKVAYIIDGQHRLKGLERAAKLDLVLPVVGLRNAELKKAAKIFADINGLQKPVSPNAILLIRYEIGDLPDLKAQATSIAHQLNDRADSPFHDRVKIYEQDTGRWLTADSFQRMLYPIVRTGPLQGMVLNDQTSNIINFFEALKRQNPAAFDEETRRDYILTQPRGIEACLGIFDRVWRRCETYEGGNFDTDSVFKQISRMSVMDWNKAKYGQLKGAGGVEMLIDQLILLLPEKDEREVANYTEVKRWFERAELVLRK